MIFEGIISCVAAFLCGSIPFGVLVSRARGVDLSKVGSGNIGATNVARALGRPLGVAVLVLDAAKSGVPVAIAARWMTGRPHVDWILVAMSVLAVLGHLYPPWLKFHGGKGVATGLGAFLALAPVAALLAVAVWLLTYVITRTSSVGSLLGALVLTGYLLVTGAAVSVTVLAVVVTVLVFWRHRGNIVRIVRRQEGKL